MPQHNLRTCGCSSTSTNQIIPQNLSTNPGTLANVATLLPQKIKDKILVELLKKIDLDDIHVKLFKKLKNVPRFVFQKFYPKCLKKFIPMFLRQFLS